MPVQHTFTGEGDPNELGIVAPEPSAHYTNTLNDTQWLWDGEEWKLVTSKDFRPAQTNVLTKNPFGRLRVLDPLPTVMTMQVTMEMSAEYYAVRIAIPNIAEVAVPGVRVSVAVTNSFMTEFDWQTSPYPNGGGWHGIEWNDSPHGSADGKSVTLPPRIASERASVTYSDVRALRSIPRLDNNPRPLLMVRVQYPAGSIVSCPQTGFFGWRSETGPHRPFRVSSEAVAGVDVKEDYTTFTSIDDNACIPIVQYFSPRAGHQIMLVGDSITEGLGGAVRDFGAVPEACNRIATADYPVEYYNCGLHSNAPQKYSYLFRDNVAEVLPTAIFYQPYSVNDVPTGGAAEWTKKNLYVSLGRVVRDARDLGRNAPVFLLEGTPTNKNFRDVGAGDQWRRDMNEYFSTMSGVRSIPGYAAAVTGLRDPDGQDLMKEGHTNDGVHPNQVGYNAMADAIMPFIISIMPEEAGLG